MSFSKEHLIANLRTFQESETFSTIQVTENIDRKTRKVYKFGLGQSPFPVPDKILYAKKSAVNRGEYTTTQGDKALRDAIAKFHSQRDGVNWASEEIVVSSGSKIINFCILAAIESADVLLPAPCSSSYEPQAEINWHEVHWIRTLAQDNWKLTPEGVEEACLHLMYSSRQKVLILNYPSNPTGQTYN